MHNPTARLRHQFIIEAAINGRDIAEDDFTPDAYSCYDFTRQQWMDNEELVSDAMLAEIPETPTRAMLAAIGRRLER